MMEQYIKVPSDRIGVIIGPQGEVKKELTERTGVKISIDSETGSVVVRSLDDPVAGMRVVEVVKAMARGFSPHRAMRLLDDEDDVLDVLNLGDVAPTAKALTRLKGRIIGKDGQMRESMEDGLKVSVSVYGKTVSVIGSLEAVQVVMEALDMLIRGAPHAVVFNFISKKRNEMRQQELDVFLKDAEPGTG